MPATTRSARAALTCSLAANRAHISKLFLQSLDAVYADHPSVDCALLPVFKRLLVPTRCMYVCFLFPSRYFQPKRLTVLAFCLSCCSNTNTHSPLMSGPLAVLSMNLYVFQMDRKRSPAEPQQQQKQFNYSSSPLLIWSATPAIVEHQEQHQQVEL